MGNKKRILLSLFFLFSGLLSFSQVKQPILVVADTSTLFNTNLAKGHLIYDSTNTIFYQIQEVGTPIHNLNTIKKKNILSLSTALGGDYAFVACVLRNTGSGWFAIDDNEHDPLNVDSVYETTSAIVIDYASLGATEVVSLVAVTDETFAGIYDFGTSAGLTSTSIRIERLNRTGKALVTHTGSGNFTIVNSSGSDWAGLSVSYNNLTGRLDITHPSSEGVPLIWDMGGNTQIVSGNNTESFVKTFVKFYNLDGTQQTLLDPEVIRFLISRQIEIAGTTDPNDVISANGNVWVLGVFKIN